jgi:hypothetical protein
MNLTTILGALCIAIGIPIGCGAAKTSLNETDQAALLIAERDCSAIVTRQDAGMPSADRALARACYCSVDGVLFRTKSPTADAGIACR